MKNTDDDGAVTVTEIVKTYLVRVGADGLCNPDAECGCELADLAPCGNIGGDCRPALKAEHCGKGDDCECGYCGNGFDFTMVALTARKAKP